MSWQLLLKEVLILAGKAAAMAALKTTAEVLVDKAKTKSTETRSIAVAKDQIRSLTEKDGIFYQN